LLQRAHQAAGPVTLRGARPLHDAFVIYEIECGQPWHVCEQARYAHEPRLRAAWHLRAGRVRGDGRLDDDDAPRRGGERPLGDDAHGLDVSVTVPSEPPPFESTFPK